MKNVFWIIIAAAIAVGAYVVFSGKSVEEAADEASGQSVDAPAALESASEATGEAVDATTEAADAAPQAVDDGGAGDVTEQTTDAASSPATDVLSVDGFNIDKASEMIDESDLGGIKKTMLKGALDKAQDDPEMLKAILGQVKAALGL